EVHGVAGADQSVPHGGAGSATIEQAMGGQGQGLETAARRASGRDATPSRAVPPRAEPAINAVSDPAFELIPASHQFGSVQIALMLDWVLSGISLRGACNALVAMHKMDVDWGFDFPVPHFTTVRFWLLRLGHYNLTRVKVQADDWIWIIDHS